MFTGAAESAAAAPAQRKFLHDIKPGLHDGHNHQLRHALHRHQRERNLAAVPQRDENLPLIIRVDQADQVAQHDTVLVSQAGTRQNHCGIARVAQMNGDAAGDELALLGLNHHIVFDARAQIDPR